MSFITRVAAWAALCLFCQSFAASAQDVSLRSHDGSVELSGTLIGFDGEYYRVGSIFGPLTIAADGVECRGPGCPDLENFVAEIRFQGAAIISSHLFPALIERFAAERDMVVRRQILAQNRTLFALVRADGSLAARFYVTGSTSSEAFAALMERRADIALATRAPDERERNAAEAAAQGDIAQIARMRVLGIDALLPLVAPDNPVERVSLSDLAQVFAGEITNWQALGGADAPIALHLLAPETGLGEASIARILAPFDLSLDEAATTHHATALELSEAVARDPFAIGIGTYSQRGNAPMLTLSGACGVQQNATPLALKAEDYPFATPLTLHLPMRRMPLLVRDFLRFLESDAADQVIRQLGFVSQSITEQPLAAQGARLAHAIAAAGEEVPLEDLQELVTAMEGATRLSSTFRFAGGTTALDAQSLGAISRLARAIERGDFDGRELVFVGFSDGQGAAGGNRRLSLGRAEAARLALIEEASDGDLNRVRLGVAAFGEALPLDCDDTETGRAVNRRVEVWLR